MKYKNKMLVFIFIVSILLTNCTFLDYAYADTYYYYDRYTVKGSYDVTWKLEHTASIPNMNDIAGKDGFSVDGSTGKWQIYGNDVTYREVYDGTKVAYVIDSYGYPKKIYRYNGPRVWYCYRNGRIYDEREKGYYVSTISASNGTYPANGISGGYWYVRGGISNIDPYLTLSTPNKNTLSEIPGFNILTISGTVLDQDPGDNLLVKYTIKDSSNNPVSEHENRIIDNIIADGTEQSFTDLNIYIDNTFAEGDYTLDIWAEDNESGKSIVETVLVTVDKTGPSLYTNKTQVISLNGYLKVEIIATDASNPLNDVPIIYTSPQINLNGIGNFKVITDKIFINPKIDSDLNEGNEFYINIEATDNVGNKTQSNIKLKIDSTGNTNPSKL